MFLLIKQRIFVNISIVAILIKEKSSFELRESEYLVYHENFYPEILMIEQGKGYIGIDGENHKVVAPCVLLIHSNQRYDLFARSPMIANSIVFQTELREDCPLAVLKVAKEKRKLLLSGDEQIVISTIEGVINDHMIALQKAEEGYSNETIVFRVKEYLKDNYKGKVDFKILAGTFGYSYDRFRHIFRETAGTTLNKYLLDYRFEESKKLLIESDFYVKQIAAVTGFNSSVYFNNFFKGRYHVTPHCYRRALRDNEGVQKIYMLPEVENGEEN
jgi:AraC-like DNA-binding protein